MSELTLCNRCTLDDIERRYGKERVHVHRQTLAEESATFRIAENSPHEHRTWYQVDVDGEAEPIAFFMELTAECAC